MELDMTKGKPAGLIVKFIIPIIVTAGMSIRNSSLFIEVRNLSRYEDNSGM